MRSSEGRLAVGPGESWTSVEALIDLRWHKAAWRHSTRVSGVEQIYTCPRVIGPVTVIVGAVSEDDGKAAVGTGQMSGRPLSSPSHVFPFSLSLRGDVRGIMTKMEDGISSVLWI